MMIRRLLTIVLGVVATAAAAEPSALLRCDGYGGRMHTGEALARLPLVLGSMGLLGSPEADRPAARETGDKAIAACTEALTDARVSGTPIRHAEVLLMRGVREYGAGQFDAAFADGAAIVALTPATAERAAFERSLGVSGRLLEAYARYGAGRLGEADALAAEAAALRPWGHFIAEQALAIMAATPAISPARAELLDRLMRQWPGTARAAAREAAGDWAGAARDDAAIGGTQKALDPLLGARRAASLALAGDDGGATAALQELQQPLDEMATRASGADATAQTAAQIVTRTDELVALTRVQLALNAGKSDEARTLFAARPRWLAPVALVAAVATNVRLHGAAVGPDPVKLRADPATLARTALTGPAQVNIMALGWPRFEDGGVLAAFGRDLAPGSTAIKQQVVDGRRRLAATRAAFIDTAGEAMFVAAAAAARAAGKAEFAVVLRGSAIAARREGLAAIGQTWDIILPGDDGWASQTTRTIGVADVDAALAPLFPPPATTRR